MRSAQIGKPNEPTDSPTNPTTSGTAKAVEKLATPKEFDTALKNLLLHGYQSGVAFDRSWTFRDPETDRPDQMVEITELASRSTSRE
ncbi:hypothetical protein [Haladaptatus sp. DFWS20]|uniref:hypothetical protein n=1 Tax=Haladaptatus sp. DFWS20 TaxID=3403467 RepID=UPI003EB6F865